MKIGNWLIDYWSSVSLTRSFKKHSTNFPITINSLIFNYLTIKIRNEKLKKPPIIGGSRLGGGVL